PAALREFRDALEIRQRLAEQDPENAGWLRDLSVSHNKIGDVLSAQGDLPAALREFRDALEIRQRLAEQDPGNAGWQTDVAGSCWRIAHAVDRTTPQGRTEAVGLLEQALAILERLAARERLIPVWQGRLPRFQKALDELQSTDRGQA
ncbi:MAG: tetratricopeptide repeat protein, partial [bacterium]|nr:tetratricopeptide repeat protein [bacterium]